MQRMPKKRNSQQNSQLTLIQLVKEADFKTKEVSLFDCGDKDLNEFFHDDAWDYKRHLLAETYLFYPTALFETDNRKPIAYISLCNDCIQLTRGQRKNELKCFFKAAIKKGLPYEKQRLHSFPAVKIARLGVQKEYCRGGIGTHLLNMVKRMFLTENRTGCKFLTVDAYNKEETLNFYLKNQFDFLWDKKKEDPTRIMWFDLSRFNVA